MTAVTFSAIPEIDISRARVGDERERAALIDELRQVCHEVGFFHLVGHGVPAEFLDRYTAQLQAFFALPESVKAAIDKVNSRHFRGWERVGAELTDNRTDYREQIDLSGEHPPYAADIEPAYLRLDGPNQWLPDEERPGFRATVEEWFSRLGALADELMGLLALGLGLDEGHFRRLFGERPLPFVKLISYPRTPEGEAGVNAHHDAGFLTILFQDKVGGLQALNPDGEWIDVPPRRDAFVVNLGEMLQALTGNYFVATTHRVDRHRAPVLVGLLPRSRSAHRADAVGSRPVVRRRGGRQPPPCRRRFHGQARRAAGRAGWDRQCQRRRVRRTAVELLPPQLPGQCRSALPGRRRLIGLISRPAA